MFKSRFVGIVVGMLLVFGGLADAGTLHVPGDFSTIQACIDAAVDGDECVVAKGTYNENINFLGKAITVRSTDPANPSTMLATIIDGGGIGTVVTCNSGEGPATVLSGFLITNGSAEHGGGMRNDHSGPTVTHCTFSGNSAAGAGGGMIIHHSSTGVMVTNCTFSTNSAGSSGGGMRVELTGGVTVTKCTFSGNSARGGGGMGMGDAAVTVTNCTFSGNSASSEGGGIKNIFGFLTVTNCTFSGNTAGGLGGGMANVAFGTATVTNCTFSGNSADAGGGMHNEVGFGDITTVTNSVLWGDSPEEIASSGGLVIEFSDVQGGWAGDGNIDDDPLFVDADGADGVPGTDDDNLRLLPGSPCINAGDTAALPLDAPDLDGDGDTDEPIPHDLDGHARVLCKVVDMGAYEFGIGDDDCDQDVDLNDFEAYLECVTGPTGDDLPPGCIPFDFDGDGDVDFGDWGGLQDVFSGFLLWSG